MRVQRPAGARGRRPVSTHAFACSRHSCVDSIMKSSVFVPCLEGRPGRREKAAKHGRVRTNGCLLSWGGPDRQYMTSRSKYRRCAVECLYLHQAPPLMTTWRGSVFDNLSDFSFFQKPFSIGSRTGSGRVTRLVTRHTQSTYVLLFKQSSNMLRFGTTPSMQKSKIYGENRSLSRTIIIDRPAGKRPSLKTPPQQQQQRWVSYKCCATLLLTAVLVDHEAHLLAVPVVVLDVPEVGRRLGEDHSQDQFSGVWREIPPVHLVLFPCVRHGIESSKNDSNSRSSDSAPDGIDAVSWEFGGGVIVRFVAGEWRESLAPTKSQTNIHKPPEAFTLPDV